jgi:hypothetical protein
MESTRIACSTLLPPLPALPQRTAMTGGPADDGQCGQEVLCARSSRSSCALNVTSAWVANGRTATKRSSFILRPKKIFITVRVCR